jgi:hypothetical protein
MTDDTAPKEDDPEGNHNNFLTPDRITKHTPATAGIMSSVAPTSTTYELAKDVPLEKSGSSDLPGAFPETPATEPAAFSVNPIPATAGAGNPIHLAPGEKVPDASTITSNTVSSTVHDDMSLAKSADKPEQTFSVAPIPATAGTGNPVHLGAGEPIPTHSELTANTVDSTVRTDKESYEKADAGAPVLPPVVTPEAEREEKGTGVFGLPPVSKNMIPESSLPMGEAGVGAFDAGPIIQSAGANSTTAEMRANVPLVEKPVVPEMVKESQEEAGVDPEASAIPEEIKEKGEVEKELLKQVPEAPVTSDDTTVAAKSAGATVAETGAAVGAAALAVGGAAAAYASAAKDKAAEGIAQASNTETAQTATSYLTGAKDKVAEATGLDTSSAQATADTTPEVVKESIAESGQSPEAAAYAEPVAEKSAMEKELLSEVKLENSTGEPAPKIEETKALSPPPATDSRDISPTTVPGTHKPMATEPVVTTGVAAATTEKTTEAPSPSSTPSKPTSASPAAGSSAAAEKKNKRRSFFGKIKDKLKEL